MTKALEATKQLWLDSRKCENTRRAYENAVKAFESAGFDLETAQRDDVVEYMISLKTNGKSGNTINLQLSALSSFYRFAIRHEVLRKNPADIEREKVNPFGKSTFLEQEQCRALLGKIDRTTVIGCRDYALLFGYLMTGLRNSAWRVARLADFNRKQGSVYYTWSLKGAVDAQAFIAPPLWEAIMELAKATRKGPNDYLFTAFSNCSERFLHVQNFKTGGAPISSGEANRILNKYAAKAGLDPKEIRIHTLRHTLAMLLLDAGEDVLSISKALGHKNIAVTQIYLDHMRPNQNTSWQTVSQYLGAS